MKYEMFQNLIDTMEQSNYDYMSEISNVKNNEEKLLNDKLTLSDHVKTMIYAQLSNNRPWKIIEQNAEKLNQIFCNFNIDELKKCPPDRLISQITEIHCGNRQIKNQIICLRENIEMIETINIQEGGINKYFINTDIVELVKNLSIPDKKYKLKYMGVALVCEYLKNIGINVVKPDSLICRLIGRLGFSKKFLLINGKPLKFVKKLEKSIINHN